MIRKSIYFLTLGFLMMTLIFACKKKGGELPEPKLLGGKNGNFSIAVFTNKTNGVGKSSRVFLRYASNFKPMDTLLCDEKSNTMIEPGFGPHTHFNALSVGTYSIHAMTKDYLLADTILEINENSAKSQDIYLKLR